MGELEKSINCKGSLLCTVLEVLNPGPSGSLKPFLLLTSVRVHSCSSCRGKTPTPSFKLGTLKFFKIVVFHKRIFLYSSVTLLI